MLQSFGIELILDFLGVAVFAASGALAASRKQLDMVGFVFFAAVTGVGGGTLRDLILGQTPVFWVREPGYLIVCALIGLLIFFTAHFIESRYKVLLWLDAVGVAAYSVVGAATGLHITGSATVAIVTGIMTATFGGILRDTLAGEKSVILRPEIYITAAFSGALCLVAMDSVSSFEGINAAVSFFVAFVVRGTALQYGFCLPTYRARKARSEEELCEKGIIIIQDEGDE